jgi:hypothetical protein
MKKNGKFIYFSNKKNCGLREKSKSCTVFTRYSGFHRGLWNSEAEGERHPTRETFFFPQSTLPKGTCSHAASQTCTPPTPQGPVNMQYEKMFHLTKQDSQQPAGFSKAPLVLHGDGI